MSEKVRKSPKEWRDQLDSAAYHITREKGTEAAFTGKYHAHKEEGRYHCICCGALLFSSKDKYDSRSGWPSFTRSAHKEAVEEIEDLSHGMRRTEVCCTHCDAHLGHVFPDGPKDRGGLRYCINSASLHFAPEKD